MHFFAVLWCFQRSCALKTHLSILELHVQEVKVPKDSELLLGGGVVHVVCFPGPIIGGHQAGLVLHEVQFPATGEYHLNRRKKTANKQDEIGLKSSVQNKLMCWFFSNSNKECLLLKDFLWAPLLVRTTTKHSPVFPASSSTVRRMKEKRSINIFKFHHNWISTVKSPWNNILLVFAFRLQRGITSKLE